MMSLLAQLWGRVSVADFLRMSVIELKYVPSAFPVKVPTG